MSEQLPGQLSMHGVIDVVDDRKVLDLDKDNDPTAGIPRSSIGGLAPLSTILKLSTYDIPRIDPFLVSRTIREIQRHQDDLFHAVEAINRRNQETVTQATRLVSQMCWTR